jgi:hypothetical protein
MRYWLAELAPEATSARAPNAYVSPPASTGRRLAVTSEGRPTVLERGAAVLVLEGELYEGTRAIHGEDAARGLLSRYTAHGSSLLDGLRGVFALVLFDWAKDLAICARDPMGIHPLFYADVGPALLVSASPERLVGGTGVSNDVHRLALAEWVVGVYPQQGETFYEHVKRLPRGHRLEVEDGAARIVRYWLPRMNSPDESLDPMTAVDSLAMLVNQAVARCLGSGRAAVQVSGGVDSALVAASTTALSAARGVDPPPAFSLRSGDPEADEDESQDAVVRALGLEHHVVHDRAACGGEMLSSGIRKSGESWFPCVVPWEGVWDHLLRQARSLGCNALLSGSGGNDWLEAGWSWAADLIRRGDVRGLRTFIEGESAFYGRPMLLAVGWRHGVRLLARHSIVSPLERVAPGFVRKLLAHERGSGLPAWALPDQGLRREFIERRAARPILSPLDGSFWAAERLRRLDSAHSSFLLEMHWQIEQTVGARLRDPHYDADLVEFLNGVGPRWLTLGGEAKGLAKALLRQSLGDAQVRSLGISYSDSVKTTALREEGIGAFRMLGGAPCLEELGLVDGGAVEAALGDLATDSPPQYPLWEALACEAWLQARGEKRGGEIRGVYKQREPATR